MVWSALVWFGLVWGGWGGWSGLGSLGCLGWWDGWVVRGVEDVVVMNPVFSIFMAMLNKVVL